MSPPDPPPSPRTDAAATLATLLYNQRAWQLRKVESRVFQEGSYSLTRVSIDCIPQLLPGLRYGPAGQPDSSEPVSNAVLFMVPITLMTKGAMRRFDMADDSGRPIPVIGRSEYRDLMIEALLYELRDALHGDADRGSLRSALGVIVDADADQAGDAAISLVVDGTFDGAACIRPDELSDYAADLILTLSASYVLIALLPEDRAGRRQVLKYGHHSTDRLEGARHLKRFRLAAGLEALRVDFDLSHPAGSASHHFEITIPAGIECERLTMPRGTQEADRNTSDVHPEGVAHAVASYETNPIEGVYADFRVPFRGLRRTATLVCVLTAAILVLGLVLPGAQRALLQASDGAAALLLAVPAVAVALASGSGEPAMVAWLLRPLRSIVIACALVLLACAASIVGVLHDPWRHFLWWAAAVWASSTAVFLAWEQVRASVSGWYHTAHNSSSTGRSE